MTIIKHTISQFWRGHYQGGTRELSGMNPCVSEDSTSYRKFLNFLWYACISPFKNISERHVDLSELKASLLVYTAISSPARAIKLDPATKTNTSNISKHAGPIHWFTFRE